jgi:hypothetical protein
MNTLDTTGQPATPGEPRPQVSLSVFGVGTELLDAAPDRGECPSTLADLGRISGVGQQILDTLAT